MTILPRRRPTGRLLRRMAMALALACGTATVAGTVRGQSPVPNRQPDTVGGPGGSVFFSRCPDGQFVVGLAGRAGEVMDRVAPLCVGFDRQNHWAGEPTEGDAVGGKDGVPFTALCPRDTAVTGFSGVGSEFVINLRLVCSFPQRPSETVAVLPPVGAHPELGATAGANCRGLALSASIRGAASQFINRFGLACDASYLGDTPLPAPPPPAGQGSLRGGAVPKPSYVPPKRPPKAKTSIFAVENGGDLLFSIYPAMA
jgi:hypothetical protein